LPINIHHDPRVARGNTFSSGWRNERTGGGDPGGVVNSSSHKVLQARERSTDSLSQGRRVAVSTLFDRYREGSAAPRGELDLSRFLVEPGEGERPPEKNAETQTDCFSDCPPTPDYVPRKTGVDASTQMEELDGLFEFDAEVQPLLDVLVGK
ncbi:unnamed protein product, partial [Discosporangium mesarthrocarpum]